jgi:NADPH-dependent 2,4-dienoyl-CoA reductase/sulfur reductase-like enzyme
VLFDEQASPGGQIYRSITDTPVTNEPLLGPDYWKGARLAAAFAKSGAQYVSGATVWSLTPEREIGVSVRGGSRLLSARRVILATGALERPFPIPGWTLPGVMTAGAGQVLLKSTGLVPRGPTVLAGCGPLLWLLAAQYLRAGTKVDALLDVQPSDAQIVEQLHEPLPDRTCGAQDSYANLRHCAAEFSRAGVVRKGTGACSYPK